MPEKHRRIAPEPKVPPALKEAPGVKGINQFLNWLMCLQKNYVCLAVLLVHVDMGGVF